MERKMKGTRFLLSRDSPVGEQVKQRYLADTVVTDALDSVPQRLLRTRSWTRSSGVGRTRRLLCSVRSAVANTALPGVTWTR
jgi:hypothetical protein